MKTKDIKIAKGWREIRKETPQVHTHALTKEELIKRLEDMFARRYEEKSLENFQKPLLPEDMYFSPTAGDPNFGKSTTT